MRKRLLLFSRVIELCIVVVLFLLLPAQNTYSYKKELEMFTPLPAVSIPVAPLVPINLKLLSPPELTAHGVMIRDIASGVDLFSKNPDTQLLPASTTKIMTALITLEEYDLSDVVTVKTVETQKNTMGLITGEKITVENLLYGLLVYSANDAAVALAEHYPGGLSAFIARMNTRAQELYLFKTHFSNPIGFDSSDNYTSPEDLASLGSVALENKELEKIVGTAQITVSDTSFTYFHPLKNVNQLLGKIPGVSGIKTGFTEGAGECLVSTATRNNHKILIVILGSRDRFGETEQLINWVYANFDWQDPQVLINQYMAAPQPVRTP